MPMTLHTVLLDFLDEFEGMEPDRFTVVFRQAFMVCSEYTESLRLPYRHMTWRLVSLRFRNKWPCEFLSEKSRNNRNIEKEQELYKEKRKA
jgi:hypothetical protein